MIFEFKCLFIRFATNRSFTTKGGYRYKFFKSINLLTNDVTREYDAFECELKFHLFQFRIHLDLRSDYENELFYEKCGGGEVYNLIQKSNNYNHNYKKCFNEYSFQTDEVEAKFTIKSNGIFTDYVFYLTVVLLLSILGPVLCFTYNHLFRLVNLN